MLYKIDVEKGEGVELAREYGVRGYPTFLMISPEGGTIDRWLGYDDPPSWTGAGTGSGS